MATTITNVTELQAMEDDLTEDYVLGNDIDASATSSWNGGEGFIPVGAGVMNLSYSRPTSDDFGHAGQGGSWTIYPSDGVYYDKVDEETSDDDTTYIQATTNGDWCLLAHDATGLNLPDNATNITVVIRTRVRKVSAFGTPNIQGMLNINGTEYLVGSNQTVTSESYQLKQWPMTNDPSTGSPWTIGGVFALAVAGVGVKVSDAAPDIRITQIWILVDYDLIFTGTLNGAGYTISDLFIDRLAEDYVGLFGYTDGATIEDVTLADCDYTADDRVGALIGDASNTTVTDCHSSGGISGDAYIGGLIGYSAVITISSCDSSCIVNGDDYVGGLIGWAYDSTVSECPTTGSVTGLSDYVGGLMGVSQENDIDNCYARRAVDGDRYVGGLIGYSYDASEAVDDCYSTGVVTGNTDVGGLMGFSSSVVSNCFWDTETSGQATSAAGTGKTTAEMKAITTFSNAEWDILGYSEEHNDGYPFLDWEYNGDLAIWRIYDATRCFTIPDLFDDHGRVAKGAWVRAYRADTFELVGEGIIDQYGNATICGLPNDVDIVFHVTWGGGY